MRVNLLTLLLAIHAATSLPSFAEDLPVPLARAHAHNDYAHTRPLVDALEQGFCSVEADIFLVEDQLLVAHERKNTQPGRTLEALYLAPLRQRVAENGGRVYRNGPHFWLLVDIKSNGAMTYRALSTVLERYADILTVFGSGGIEKKAVTVIVSGDRPRDLLESEPIRYAAMDGRLRDLESESPKSLIPWISDNWGLTFKWRGVGQISGDEQRKLRSIVDRAHGQGRRVRFWATPDLAEMWQELLNAKVDFINTDDLAGLKSFLETAATPGIWNDDYSCAYRDAERLQRMLLVWFSDDPHADDERFIKEVQNDESIRQRLSNAVLVRLPLSATVDNKEKPVVLLEHHAFKELHGRSGLALVDLTNKHGPYFGQVVSVYPFSSNTNKWIEREQLLALLDLPIGSLTQRTLIFAVRTHAEMPRSATGVFHAFLASEAERHAIYQASITLQGHHNWDQRFHNINARLSQSLVAQEVCAESWPGQSLLEAARECVHSWRQSPGHWNAVQESHQVYSYDMKLGRNGVWYATGIFGRNR